MQLELFPPVEPALDREDAHGRRISGLLSMLLPQPVDVIFTRNRSTMISQAIRGGRLRLRLHRMFRLADDEVLGALARFLKGGDKDASRRLDRFIAAHREELVQRPVTPRRSKAPRRSSTHDLGAVLSLVAGRYFGGGLDVGIRWSREPRRRSGRPRTRTRALATYSYEDRIIRVNPVLDSPRVPGYVIEWIVFHELLHHVLPVERAGGKRRYHTEAFRAFERGFEHYERARRWEEENIEWLLR